MKMSDRLYKILKWSCMLFLPSCGSLYIALASVWGFGYTFEVSASISAVCVFLGALIGISASQYKAEQQAFEEAWRALDPTEKTAEEETPAEEEEEKEEETPSEEEIPEQKGDEGVELSASGKVYLSPSNQYDNLYAYGDTNEADNCEAIAALLKVKLEEAGVEVMLASRDEDMEARCNASNNFGAQLHIPIHTNAFNGEVMGTRMFYVDEAGKKSGQYIYERLAPTSPGTSDNFSENTDLYELNNPACAAAYVEIEFHDAVESAKWLVENHELIATRLAEGICSALNAGVDARPAVNTLSDEERYIGGECICEPGNEYELTCNMKVREYYGTDARWKEYSELSADGQAHAVGTDKAVLASGTSVTCLEVYKNWIRIPSGWICARDLDGTDNVKVYEGEAWQINAIRNQLAQWSDPRNQGFSGMCEGWVFTVYYNAGLSYRGMNHSYCCANANRDNNAESGSPSNGDIVYSGTGYNNVICDCCGRHCGHVGIYMDGYVYGSQTTYACPYDTWVASFGYGGHSNLGNW